MERQTVFNEVKELLITQQGIDPVKVTEDSRMRQDLGLDSLDQMELVLECEKQFAVSIDDSAWDKQGLETPRKLVDYIMTKEP